MKRIVLLLLAALLPAVWLFGQDLISKKGPGDKWGFVDLEGNFVITPQFDAVQQEFTLGMACVKKDSKVFLINVAGNAVSEKYAWMGVFDEGLCKVNVGGKVDESGNISGGSYGFITLSGEYAVKPIYEYIGNFNSRGLALICNGCKIAEDGTPQGGKFGYINRDGSIVIPAEYDFIGEFDNAGRCWVNKGGRKFEGDKGIDAQINAMLSREKNLKKLAEKRDELENAVTGGKRDPFGRKAVGGLYGMFSSDGTPVINVKYSRIGDFCEGLCRVEKNGSFGYVDDKMNEVAPCTYNDAAAKFKEGRAWVKMLIKKEPLYGYIDTKGNVVIDFIYRSVTDFDDGVAIVSKPGEIKRGVATSLVKYGLIDRDGKVLTDMKYDLVSRRGGVLYCKLSGKYCYVSDNGKELTPPVIVESKPFVSGQSRVRVSSFDAAVSVKGGPLVASGNATKDKGLWLVIDSVGTVISDTYEKISDLSEGVYCVKKDGNYGYMDKNGNVIIPLQYADGHSFDNGYASVKNAEGKWGYLTASGQEIIPCKYDKVYDKNPEKLGIVLEGDKWGGISMSGETIIPFLLVSDKDAATVAKTIYVEADHKPLDLRSVDLFNARTKGYESRFSIKDVISSEYWDY